MVKNIQVNDQIHKVLVALKAILMKQKQRQISFNEVIAHEVTKANAFSQLVVRLIRNNPMIKLDVEKIAQEQGTSEIIQSTIDQIIRIKEEFKFQE